jgi:hypothetical protein
MRLQCHKSQGMRQRFPSHPTSRIQSNKRLPAAKEAVVVMVSAAAMAATAATVTVAGLAVAAKPVALAVTAGSMRPELYRA